MVAQAPDLLPDRSPTRSPGRASRLARLALLAAWLSAFTAPVLAGDWRALDEGLPIPSEAGGYVDHPFLIQTADGHWLVVYTTGPAAEGSRGQYVAVRRSADHGLSWSTETPIEPAGRGAWRSILAAIGIVDDTPPASSWGLPYLAPGGRMYVLYNLDTAGIDVGRNDTIGDLVFRYSDDHGVSWSPDRHLIANRLFQIDRDNSLAGAATFQIPFAKPRTIQGAVWLSLTKHANPPPPEASEIALIRSPDLASETDPARITFEMLPEGDVGLRAPAGGRTEELTFDALADGHTLYGVARSVMGRLLAWTSRDGGRHWAAAPFASYALDGRPVRNPRGPAIMSKLPDGRFLLLHYNNGAKGFANRNPYWLSAGIERDRMVVWSEPEILLYDRDPRARPGYADVFVDPEDGELFIIESDKTAARVHPIPRPWLETLYTQPTVSRLVADSPLLDLTAATDAQTITMPILDALDEPGTDGFTIELGLRVAETGIPASEREEPKGRRRRSLLDWRDQSGKGGVVRLRGGALELRLSDGERVVTWRSDPGSIRDGTTHHATIHVDARAKVIHFVIDGRLNDGGSRKAGWTFLDPDLADVNGAPEARIGSDSRSSLQLLRLYRRSLMTTEAIGHWRAYAGKR